MIPPVLSRVDPGEHFNWAFSARSDSREALGPTPSGFQSACRWLACGGRWFESTAAHSNLCGFP